MAKTTFANGTVVTAAFLNAINNPVFVDTADDDGEIPKITNNNLSTANGQLLPEWQTFRDMLKVSQATSTSISYTAGVVTLANGTQQSINAGTLTSITVSSYILVREDGTVGSGLVSDGYPSVGVVLAKATASNGVITEITDLRPRFSIGPTGERIRLFGGNGGLNGSSDFTSTNGGQLNDGLYYFRNFTVSTGHTITIGQFARIYCSGTFTVQSGATITVTTALIHPSARVGLLSNLRYSMEGGVFGPNNNYSPHQFPIGATGSSGGARTADGVLTNVSHGGPGGGAIWVEANRAISVSGTITAIGGNGSGPNTPTGEYISGGGGGGSGGAIMLTSLASITIASTGILSVAGGNGSNGSRAIITNSRGYGGSGGGGGWVWLTAPTVTTTGSTIILGGGTPGTTASNGSASFTEAGGYGGCFGGDGGYTSGDGGTGSPGQLITRTYKAVA